MVYLPGFLRSLVIFVCGTSCLHDPILTAPKVIEIAKGINSLLRTKNSNFEIKGNASTDEISNTIIRGMISDYEELKFVMMTRSSSDLRDKLANKMNQISENINNVQSLYKLFSYLYIHRHYFNATKMNNFSRNSPFNNSVELSMTIKEIHKILVDDTEGKSLVTIIAESRPSETMCINGGSAQQIIFTLYEMAVVTHTKGLLILLYILDMKEQFKNVDYGKIKQEAIDDYYSTINDTFEKVKKAMSVASRELWKCDPPNHKRGLTFLKLHPVFQAMFAFIIPKYLDFNRLAATKCDSLNGMRLDCEGDDCQKPSKIKACRGILRNCNFLSTELQLCAANEFSSRKYEWMKTREGVVYGHAESSCWYQQFLRVQSINDPCQCTCESEAAAINRYFSLQNVLSDVHLNKVVTGARIVLKNNVFHIQIQQGVLGVNGTIVNEDTEWKPVRSITSEELSESSFSFYSSGDGQNLSMVNPYDNSLVYAVRPNRNTVYLHDLEGQMDELVTGLRFQRDEENLTFDIQVTSFNYSTGQLIERSTVWLSHNGLLDRSEVVLTEPDEPIRAPTQSDQFSHGNQFVRFRMSDLKKDLGQSTVPFIDSQYVVTNPPSPLSGAGIFHKGNNNYGGFLALKLIHLDLLHHVSNN